MFIDLEKLSRLEIITKDNGREVVYYGNNIDFSTQDGGKTLKIFLGFEKP